MAIEIDLAGRACLVVGGAGGGIGTAMTQAAADAGAVVGIVTNLQDHADDSLARLQSTGARVRPRSPTSPTRTRWSQPSVDSLPSSDPSGTW